MTAKWFFSFFILAVGIAVGWTLPGSSAQETPRSAQEGATAASEKSTDSKSPLATLDWLVGSWSGKTEKGAIEFSCRFTKNNSFLIRSFRILNQSEVAMSGMQIVAWDPAQQTIRSWTYDSNGGFGEDTWSQAKDHYTMRSKYTLADGGKGSALNVMTYVDENAFLWKSTNREIDGELQPDTAEIALARVENSGSDGTNRGSFGENK